ncbi:thermonuclease family protein [Tepidamorphus sp. 3E244]|uniref:thermonuclease family protein n=1 Tax=Tepidamorphus sp. 3E244 TaxID=3385498 RepID=UPI0038FC4121
MSFRQLMLVAALLALCVLAGALLSLPSGNEKRNVGAPASPPPDVAAAPEPEQIPPPDPVFEDIAPVRNISPPDTTPWPMPEGPVERIPADPLPLPPPEPPKPDTLRRVVVEDARTLKTPRQTITLANIETRSPDAKCTDPDGYSWPCGQAAITELRMLIRGRAVVCDPLPDDAAETTPRRCDMGSFDIGEWMVERGWAEPAPGAPEAYRKAHDLAVNEKRGAYGRAWGRD